MWTSWFSVFFSYRRDLKVHPPAEPLVSPLPCAWSYTRSWGSKQQQDLQGTQIWSLLESWTMPQPCSISLQLGFSLYLSPPIRLGPAHIPLHPKSMFFHGRHVTEWDVSLETQVRNLKPVTSSSPQQPPSWLLPPPQVQGQKAHCP